jgi:hypothetical protein
MTHLDIVKLLVANNADIQVPILRFLHFQLQHWRCSSSRLERF